MKKERRTWLSVPYEERNAAKSLGARWNRARKSWFVPEGLSPAPFARWNPDAKPAERQDPVQEFTQACRRKGLAIEGAAIMDGTWRRVAVEGDGKGKKSGSYRGFLDGRPAGQIMNYRLGEEAGKWVAAGERIGKEARAALERQAAERREEAARARLARQSAVAKRAQALFAEAGEDAKKHPYLVRKDAEAFGLRCDRKGGLLVPMRTAEGALMNVQRILPDGAKRFLRGGRKVGLMHRIEGNPDAPIIIAEGYATAASLHKATGASVVVAFDAGNLTPVARALRKAEPERALVIAADDDHDAARNVGRDKARAAAQEVGATVLMPDLTAREKERGMTDFNDIARSRGLSALAARLALIRTLPPHTSARRATHERTKARAISLSR